MLITTGDGHLEAIKLLVSLGMNNLNRTIIEAESMGYPQMKTYLESPMT